VPLKERFGGPRRGKECATKAWKPMLDLVRLEPISLFREVLNIIQFSNSGSNALSLQGLRIWLSPKTTLVEQRFTRDFLRGAHLDTGKLSGERFHVVIELGGTKSMLISTFSGKKETRLCLARLRCNSVLTLESECIAMRNVTENRICLRIA
jgi:hypothetical protein